ncbi:type II toxin-antitoxin system RelE/ParE family toxin [Glaciecola sp. XM2]|uniref:type II toxin-antitoxin system RelE/ParE family toxin n=1 Tax=Glaciecola sp. XM2 TaxID=1914931 RepID=UPI001BDE7ECE|nr:type II toxin-antitoxin system RelE/ParE family toxin [Glaciecola sp. XM2]
MKRFNLSVKAKQDLKDIAIFTESRWGREQRNLYLQQIDSSFAFLANKSHLGKLCDEVLKGYYKFPHGSHIIFFKRIDRNTILIVRILHKRMDYAENLNG